MGAGGSEVSLRTLIMIPVCLLHFLLSQEDPTVPPITFLGNNANGAFPTLPTSLLHPAPLGTLHACVWIPQSISLCTWPPLGCRDGQASSIVRRQDRKAHSGPKGAWDSEDREFGVLGTQRLMWKGATCSGGECFLGSPDTTPCVVGCHQKRAKASSC